MNKTIISLFLTALCPTAIGAEKQSNWGLEGGATNYYVAPFFEYKMTPHFRSRLATGIFLAQGSGELFYDTSIQFFPKGKGFNASLGWGTHVLHEKKESKVTKSYSNDDGLLRSESGTDSYSFPTATGFSTGIGYEFTNHWQLDLMYVLTSSADDSDELKDAFSESTSSTDFSTRVTTDTSESTAAGPDGSGSFWLKASYRF